MKKKKNKNWLVLGFIILLVVILIVLINSTKGSSASTKLNLTEKKWIESNKKDVINVSVANNIPIFSNEGEGVFFNFLDNMEDKTGLTFNLISYDSSSSASDGDLYFDIIKKSKVEKLDDKDMVFFKDYYVLVSKSEEKIDNPDDINNKKIGVLKDDLADVSFYLSGDGNSYSTYEKSDELKSSLTSDEVNYIAVPKTRYYDYILSNNYHVSYNMTDLKEAYVLKTSKAADDHLASITKKSFIDFKNNKLEKKYNDSLSEFLLTENNVSEKSKADFLSKKYVFGYIINKPYVDMINNKLIGLDSTYLDSFSKLTGATFTYKKYRSVKDLTKALNNEEVDIASNSYNYSGLSGKYSKTISPYTEEYVVLVNKSKSDVIVNSVKSLKNVKVSTTNTSLAKYLKEEAKAKVTAYDRLSTLLNRINEDSVIVLDKDSYDINKSKDLKDYHVIYTEKANLSHGYIINNTNENSSFNTLFTKYLETSNYKQLYNTAWVNYNKDSKEVSYGFLYLIGAVILAFIVWIFAKKKIKIKKKSKHEQIVRYVDPLTSLKNRNYLNKNFSKWENNAIYPQSIIVINLNNLRHINDVYGHEEGDKLLKQAANILIKNQLEQSDIIRTDGNEYLIYMVGYEKNKVVAYMRKLYKELSELPYGFGATLGYSMIEDDIKTIDDAINEAVLEIRANKEMKNKK